MSPSPLGRVTLITPLSIVSYADLELVGGKGANLGELVRKKFRVPPGFVLTTQAYEWFTRHNHLSDAIVKGLAEANPDGSTIRAAFEKAAIPAEVEQELLAAYRALGEGPVAVRSSATAEDLPQAAFAGQQETFLNVLGQAALLEAVRRCWASLWTERAIAYRQHKGVDQLEVRLAVVVQRMVQAQAAGVLFTANPVTGARHEMVVDASPGLGEAVVSGLVTPDHYVLRRQRRDWSIIERVAGRREVIIQSKPGGGTEHLYGGAGLENLEMPDSDLCQLARTGAATQRHFGSPQDIEWAWADGELFILQTRPITALPAPLPHANKVQRLVASNFGELFLHRPFPLDMTSWIPALSGALEPVFQLMGLKWRLSQLFEEENGVVVRFKGRLPRPTWKTLFGPARMLMHILRYDPLNWQADPLLAEMQKKANELEKQRFDLLTWEQLLEIVPAAQAITYSAGELRRRYFPRSMFAMARLRIFLSVLGQGGRFGTLITGAENKTSQANRALEKLADYVRSNTFLADTFSTHSPHELFEVLWQQPQGTAFLKKLRAFMDSYGHREAVISTSLQPTWKDAPEVVLGVLKSFAAHPPQTQKQQPAWQVARDQLLTHPLLRRPLLRSTFLETLTLARAFLALREDTHFYATMSLPVFRRTLMEMGQRLFENDVLDSKEDVYHLRIEELAQAGSQQPLSGELKAELRRKVEQRKAKRASLEGIPLIDPRLFMQNNTESEALLRGMPGSPGEAQGPVCIIRDGFEFDKLQPGDVLVAPFTNPSWTPLFERAAAVVVDTGSLGSHAAIVAREYGIPAVMSTVTGTSTLKDGELVRVDGSRGAVFAVEPGEVTRLEDNQREDTTRGKHAQGDQAYGSK